MKSKAFAPVLVSFAAGPLMFSVLMLLDFATRPASDLGTSDTFGLMLLSIPIGFLISIVPNTIGSIAMSILSDLYAWAKRPLAWSGAGVLGGLAIVMGTASESTGLALPFAATGGCCAWMCHKLIRPD